MRFNRLGIPTIDPLGEWAGRVGPEQPLSSGSGAPPSIPVLCGERTAEESPKADLRSGAARGLCVGFVSPRGHLEGAQADCGLTVAARVRVCIS